MGGFSITEANARFYLSGSLFEKKTGLPSGKLSHNYGKIHHVQWENPLFQCDIFNSYFDITRGYSPV